ncbi:MAG: arylsulfatase [Phocaeicola sp.]|nr:arylsulfatase [Phocaeicola sp.]
MNNSFLIMGVTTLGAAFTGCTSMTKQDQRPNIIYILADDMGLAEMGCYGQQLIETPNIDMLAANGMLFTNHYCGQAVSAPSRCVLFTGLHTGHAYIRGNDEVGSRGAVWDHAAMLADSTLEGQRPVPANTIMIPRKLKEAGYITGCVGKWGLGWPGSESTPNKMGFDFFYGYNCQRQAHTYYPPFLYRNERREYLTNHLLIPGTKLDEDADPYSESSYDKYVQTQYAPDLIYDELIAFVDRSKDKPFALFWTNPVPHVPLQAPEKWIKYYVDKFGTEEPYLGNQGYFPCRYPRATYAAMISHFDEQIGGLINKLKKEGIYENTLIVFTSDNGPSFNGGTDSFFFDSAKPHCSASGWGKASLQEGGIHVPMIASWPKKIKKGTTSDLLSAFWDIMPTFCEVAGVESPQTDGISMLPTLLGKEQKEQHEFLYWEYPESGGQKAVRMGKWKALVKNIRKGNKQIELYNLELDPREQTDIARYYPDVVDRVKEILISEHEDSPIERFQLPNF